MTAGAVTPGTWYGGDPTDEDPFFVCLNVAPDGRTLTAQGTKCRGNQGKNRNAFDIQWQDGRTPSDLRCNQNSNRDIGEGDVPIGADGRFTYNFKNFDVDTTVTGVFDADNNTVSGTARTVNRAVDCTISWTATPESDSNSPPRLPPDTDPPTPEPPPATSPDGITPGRWEGGNQGTENPFYACLNVSADGKRLTSDGTRCRGNQGQNRNAINTETQVGSSAGGGSCNANGNRQDNEGDLAIDGDGNFTSTFRNTWVDVRITGTFNAAGNSVSGTTVVSGGFGECTFNWTATPSP